MNIKHETKLSPRQIGAGLGKLCRYAGRGAFISVLLHSFVVADMLPKPLKCFGLLHDSAECLIADVPSPYKNTEMRQLEVKIYTEISKHLGVRLPTKNERAQVKHADHRSRQGEIHAGIGDTSLKHQYPVRDREAERLTKRYFRKYKPADTIRSNGKAVSEFVRRFHEYRKEIK